MKPRRFFQTAQPIESPLLTVKDVATLLGLSEASIYRAVRERGLPVRRLSARCLRFDKAAVEQWTVREQGASGDLESALRVVRR